MVIQLTPTKIKGSKYLLIPKDLAQLLEIDDALAKLARDDATAAQLVKLRYFAGLTIEEAGKAIGISSATAACLAASRVRISTSPPVTNP